MCITGPQRTRDGFDKLSINTSGAKHTLWNGNCIIGPYFIEENLNGERYTTLLLNILPLLLEDISLGNQMWMWYQHDSCPAHNAKLHAVCLIEYTPVTGLVVVDQEHSPLIFLTSYNWIFFIKNSKGHCVPACSNDTGKYVAVYY
jgi:hypothetical protein